MKIDYTLRLTCSTCAADVTLQGSDTRDDVWVAKKLGRNYESGQPQPKIKWRRDGHRIKALNDTRRWVLANPVLECNMFTGPIVPDGVGWVMKDFAHISTYVKPVEFRFIDCPACGGRAYLDSSRARAREHANTDL